MTQQNPITPPPELVEQWIQEHATRYDLARHAAQWGADQELEACCEWVEYESEELHAARRPKPPSLKEQALTDLAAAYNDDKIDDTTYETIRRALEQLDD